LRLVYLFTSYLIGLCVLCISSFVHASENRTNFKCIFSEQCGSLKGVSCFDPGAGFLLFHEKSKGFSIVMYNEVWTANAAALPSTRKDLTNLSFGAPSGEIALLTVDDKWNYAMTIHYTGGSNTLNWESGTGKCTPASD